MVWYTNQIALGNTHIFIRSPVQAQHEHSSVTAGLTLQDYVEYKAGRI